MKTVKFSILLLLVTFVFSSCAKDDEVIRSSEAKIIEYSILNIKGVINGDQIAVSVPDTINSVHTNVKSLSASVTLSDKALCFPLPNTPVDFTNPVKYWVEAEDGTVTNYWVTVTVTVAKAPVNSESEKPASE